MLRFWHGGDPIAVVAEEQTGGLETENRSLSGHSPIDKLSNEEKTVEIIQRHISALGGQSRLADLASVQAAGTIDTGDGELKPFSMVKKGEGRVRLSLGLESHHVLLGYYEGLGWRQVRVRGDVVDTRYLDAYETQSLGRNAVITNELYRSRNEEWTVSFLGEQIYDNKLCWVLKIEDMPYGELTLFIDKNTYLEVGRIQKHVDQNGEMVTSVSIYRNYQMVDGYSLPFFMETKNDDQTQTIVFEEIETNVGIFDTVFRVPEGAKDPT